MFPGHIPVVVDLLIVVGCSGFVGSVCGGSGVMVVFVLQFMVMFVVGFFVCVSPSLSMYSRVMFSFGIVVLQVCVGSVIVVVCCGLRVVSRIFVCSASVIFVRIIGSSLVFVIVISACSWFCVVVRFARFICIVPSSSIVIP